jgi:DNA-repair protein XRCC1
MSIKLENSSEIRQIDIENESSAFIEILAAQKDDYNDEFTVILPVVSFMTPLESRNKSNQNRPKIFTEETGLDKAQLDKKWNRIKIVCTQPFNTSLQFGVSKIKLYSKSTLSDEKKDAVNEII